MIRPLTLAAVAAFALAAPSQAQVRVLFQESAPKDRFTLINEGRCTFEGLTAEIDLSSAAGGLIFDVTGAGAGVEVFQPLEMAEGDVQPAGEVRDGDSTLRLALGPLGPGERAAVTIDVDDTLRNGELGQIRVAGAEIQGGRVILTAEGGLSAEGAFGSDAVAVLQVSACAV
ncbi:MAG: aggregation factor core [Pseudomonadota bacterium]